MTLLAGLILFSVLGAWLSSRQRAAGAALAFGVIGTVLFCSTPLGAALPQLINALAQGSAQVGAQLIDGESAVSEPDKAKQDVTDRKAGHDERDEAEPKNGGPR